MSSELSDYRVISIIETGVTDSKYCVEDKSGRLFVWEAIDYGLLTQTAKAKLLDEVKRLIAVNHSHLIQCEKYVDHHQTGTLYLVKRYYAGSVLTLIKKCQITNTFVDEIFIWKILYQVARAVQAMYSWGPPSVVLDITATGVQLNDEGDVKLDYSLTFKDIEDDRRSQKTDSSRGSERRQKKSDCYALGCLIHCIATLQQNPQSNSFLRLPGHYSNELESIIDLMVQRDHEKRPTIEAILYHPSLLCNVVTFSIQNLFINSAQSQTTKINRVTEQKICVKCKEFDEKLASIRNKEANIREKEAILRERELFVEKQSRRISILEQLSKEKFQKAELYLKKAQKNDHMDSAPPKDLDSSSYSADTGESFHPPTMAKLDPSKILLPPLLAASLGSRRSVKFETIPEETNMQRKWLENKRNKYKVARVKCKGPKLFRNNDKENQAPPTEKVNTSTISIPHTTKETCDGLLETFFR